MQSAKRKYINEKRNVKNAWETARTSLRHTRIQEQQQQQHSSRQIVNGNNHHFGVAGERMRAQLTVTHV